MGHAHPHSHSGTRTEPGSGAPRTEIGHGHDHHAHDHDHAHDRHDHGRGAPRSRLAIALGLTAGFLVVEAVAGLLSGSLALISDAGHMLSDAGALALALAAQAVAERPRTRTRTFGFRRAETLAGLANAAALGASSLMIVLEAVHRLAEPHDVHGAWMLAVASAGLAVNLVAAWVLAGAHKNANVRAALAHVISDAAGSVAAMIAGAAVLFGGMRWADPASSIVIAVLIGLAAVRLVRSAAGVLMEGAPAGLDVEALERTIRETEGVGDVHDLHAWRIEEGFDAVSVHVVLAEGAHGVDVAARVARRIRGGHGVTHVTVQPEARAPDGFVPISALTRRSAGRSGGS